MLQFFFSKIHKNICYNFIYNYNYNELLFGVARKFGKLY